MNEFLQKMDCPLRREETTELLLDYAARRLDAARAATIERHMENCPECRRFQREQTVVWDALDRWEPMPVSMDFNRRLWQRIDRAAQAPWYRSLADSLRLVNWKPVLPVAAAVLAIAGGFLLDHPGNRAAAPAASVPGVSVTQADQLEQTLDDIQMLRLLDPANGPNGSSKKM
jgi:anti-sigma factor RsiW